MVELKPGEAILRFRYLERNVSEALVSQLSRKFDLDLNIIFGSIELIGEIQSAVWWLLPREHRTISIRQFNI